MLRFVKASLCPAFVVLLVCLGIAGCAGPKLKPGDVCPCVPEARLEKSIAAEASLEDFSCTLKKWEGSDTLHFLVTLKNVSTQPQRYRVHIFLDNGKAVGGLIPSSTKKGLVEPGKTASFAYPVPGVMVHLPKSLVLTVKTVTP
jgi:hypothetical protein